MAQGTVDTADLLKVETADFLQLESYLKQKAPADSPFKSEKRADLLRGVESAKKANGINPMFILALAIHESGWGRSQIAKAKNNLFGWGAIDSDPFNKAWSFESYQDCCEVVIKFIKESYLTEGGKFFKEATLQGINVNYSSDKKWALGVRTLMNEIDKHVNSDDAKPVDPPAPIELGVFKRYLRRGVSGDDVKAVQTQLAALGLYDPRLIGGDFGPITEETVKKFQLQQNLEVDGVVGPLTWKALGGTVPEPGDRLLKLAKIATDEAALGLSWVNSSSKAEKYLKPLRDAMRARGDIGTAPIFYDWCGAFVLFCCREAGFALPDAPPDHWATFALVEAWRDWAKTQGFWYPRQGFLPSAGDIVIFDWAAVKGECNHIGIVRSYTPGSSTIETAEGNTGDVPTHTMKRTRNLSLVLGFIRLGDV